MKCQWNRNVWGGRGFTGTRASVKGNEGGKGEGEAGFSDAGGGEGETRRYMDYCKEETHWGVWGKERRGVRTHVH